MHHDCGLPIIHRDNKLSNILLDSEFNAKIADFGLAKIMMKQGEFDTVSNIVGSFGYFAPEHRYTKKVNEKVDVYSFWVILLELVMGKDANGEDEWSWKHRCEDTPIVDVLDEEVDEYCVYVRANTRPSMKDVLELLRQGTQLEDDSRKLKMKGFRSRHCFIIDEILCRRQKGHVS